MFSHSKFSSHFTMYPPKCCLKSQFKIIVSMYPLLSLNSWEYIETIILNWFFIFLFSVFNNEHAIWLNLSGNAFDIWQRKKCEDWFDQLI